MFTMFSMTIGIAFIVGGIVWKTKDWKFGYPQNFISKFKFLYISQNSLRNISFKFLIGQDLFTYSAQFCVKERNKSTCRSQFLMLIHWILMAIFSICKKTIITFFFMHRKQICTWWLYLLTQPLSFVLILNYGIFRRF